VSIISSLAAILGDFEVAMGFDSRGLEKAQF
jgi:hypothetical protein